MRSLTHSAAGELTNGAQATGQELLALESGPRVERTDFDRLSERREAIKLALKSGEIPALLSDEIRLIPIDSPEGARFQGAMEEIAKRFMPEWDPATQPVRFALMDLPGINACQVRGAEPPLICFNVGCFKETVEERGKRVPPLTSVDEIALIFAHEQVHLAIERRYNPERNSKLEEAMASYSSVEATYLAGFDPRAGLDWQRNRIHGAREWCWSEVFDEHPISSNSLSIYETALTALNRKYGAIRATPTPLQEDSDLCLAAQGARHTSTLEQQLVARDYSESSVERKVDILVEIIETGEYLDSRRIEDLCRTIRTLRKELGVEPTALDKAFAPLFDSCLALTEEGHVAAAKRLLTWVAGTKGGFSYRPIGRLAPLAEACRDFIEASDMLSARAAAMEVARLSDAEPLTQTDRGLRLIKDFALPQFEYPDSDKVERSARRGGVPLHWNGHVKFAREESARYGEATISRAMLILGVDDERLYGTMDPSLALQFFTDNLNQISAGPRDGSSTVYDLTIARGRAIKIAVISDEQSSSRDEIRLEYLSRHAAQMFERLAVLPEGEERAGLVSDLERIAFWVSRVEEADAQQALLGLRTLEAAPELFVALNLSRITSVEGQQALLSRVRELHAAGNTDAIRRVFFELGKETAISPPELTSGESTFGAWREMFAAGPEGRISLFSSRLLDFAVSADPPIFSVDEKLTLLAKSVNWLGLLDYSLSVKARTDELTIDGNGRKHLGGLIAELAPTVAEQGMKLTTPRSWNELEKQIEELSLASHPLGQPIVMAETGSLLSAKSRGAGPTTAQIVRILRLTDRQLYGESEGITGRRATGDLAPFIRERLAELITDPPTWSADLGDAIGDWQTLYRAGVLPAATQYRHLAALLDRIESVPTAGERLAHYETLLGTPEIRIGDPETRERVIKSWANEVRAIHGADDRSEMYQGAILEIIDRVKPRFTTRDRSAIFNTLANEIESQRALTKAIEERSAVLTTDLFAQTHSSIVVIEGGESLVVDSREKRYAIIDYLSSGLTDTSVGMLTDSVLEWLEKDEEHPDRIPLKRRIEGQLIDFHKNFWAAPLEARALIMKEILTPHTVSRQELTDEKGATLSVETARARRTEDAFQYTLERVFPDSAPHAEASRRWVSAYIEGMPDYSRQIALSALLVAGQKTVEAQKGTGFAIASFLESMGPAETKAGQAAQGHPKTPDDIRTDLGRLKTHADEPTRWELFNLIDGAFPVGATCPIDTVGEVLGSASLYVAVDVQLKDGSTAVLSLLRPNALDRARFGFELMAKMVDRFDQRSDSFRVMRELIGDARELADVETQPRFAEIQRERAGQVYNGTTVSVDGERVRFAVPAVTGVGDKYVLSVRAPGDHFIDLPAGEGKLRLAKAIMTVELNNILSGRPFDNDRHGGNCRIEGNTVHHFDFGGMMLEDPAESDLRELGEAVVAAGLGAKSVDDFVSRYFEVLRDRQANGEEVSPILKRAQKALLSIAEYSTGMSKEDLIDVLVSAAAHDLHPAVRGAVEDAVMGALMSQGANSSGIDLPRILGALEDPPIQISRGRR